MEDREHVALKHNSTPGESNFQQIFFLNFSTRQLRSRQLAILPKHNVSYCATAGTFYNSTNLTPSIRCRNTSNTNLKIRELDGNKGMLNGNQQTTRFSHLRKHDGNMGETRWRRVTFLKDPPTRQLHTTAVHIRESTPPTSTIQFTRPYSFSGFRRRLRSFVPSPTTMGESIGVEACRGYTPSGRVIWRSKERERERRSGTP